ncbi:HYR domain-containing protein, partial [Saprospiraceae bacterium]|nr:HYR domain-containing protein [Saprospiraceae bacterium]
VTGSITASTVQGCDDDDAPAAETTVAGLEGLTGNLMISDACTADGALTVTNTETIAGTYPTVITRTYLVVDACGNTTADIVHTITVDDTVAPVISCLDDFDFDLVDVNNCFADVDTSIVDIFDACTSEADMELTIMVQLQTSPGIFALPGAETISIVHNSMTNVFDISATNLRAGLNLVTVTAEDEKGNSTTCTFYITVNDLFGPVINSCPNNITVTAAEGECEVAVNWTLPLISDPCDAVTYTASHNPNDFFAVDSTTTVTYEAMDPAGNITTCSFDITVEGDCPLEVDLRAQYSLQGNTYNEGDFRDQVVRVRNIGDDDSEGEISVFVSGLTAFDVVFDPNMTTANILIGTTTVNNQDWTATVLAGGVLYTSSVVIPAGSESKIGLSTEALVAGQDGNLNISILNNSGGDNDNTNNSANKFLVISLN